jgi:hypothetical protein
MTNVGASMQMPMVSPGAVPVYLPQANELLKLESQPGWDARPRVLMSQGHETGHAGVHALRVTPLLLRPDQALARIVLQVLSASRLRLSDMKRLPGA